MMQRAPVLLAALWWGSLTTVGFLVVPMLFAHLPTPSLAGNTAARLFSAQTWVSLACGLLLLVFLRSSQEHHGPQWPSHALLLIVSALLLALLTEFAVAPRIVARDNLKLWHGVGTAFYVLQWLCTLILLWQLAGPPDRVAEQAP